MTELASLSSEVPKSKANGKESSNAKSSKGESSGRRDSAATKSVSEDQLNLDEGEKERAIAKAALSVAELSEYFFVLIHKMTNLYSTLLPSRPLR